MSQTTEPNGGLASTTSRFLGILCPRPMILLVQPHPPRVNTEEGRGYSGSTSCSQPPGCEHAVSGSATRKSCCAQQCGKWAREEGGGLGQLPAGGRHKQGVQKV